MKNIIFVWIPIVLFMAFLVALYFMDYPVPLDGAIILLGSSISGYTGVKAFGVSQSARRMPTGKGVSQETKDKLIQILIALYIIIAEALVIQYLKPEVELPLNQLFTMAGLCSCIILGGSQAIKTAELKDGGK